MNHDLLGIKKYYPADSEKLNEFAAGLSNTASPGVLAKGVLLPRAPDLDSGKIVIATISRLLPKKHIIIIGLDHNSSRLDFRFWPKIPGKFADGFTIDGRLAELLSKEHGPVKETRGTRELLPSIEIQLPILRHSFKRFCFLPITCPDAGMEDCAEAAGQIAAAVKNIRGELLLVASANLTQAPCEQAVRNQDRKIIEALINLDPRNLIDEVKNNGLSLRDKSTLVLFIFCLKELRVRKSQISLYRTHTAGDDHTKPVSGYAGMIFK